MTHGYCHIPGPAFRNPFYSRCPVETKRNQAWCRGPCSSLALSPHAGLTAALTAQKTKVAQLRFKGQIHIFRTLTSLGSHPQRLNIPSSWNMQKVKADCTL